MKNKVISIVAPDLPALPSVPGSHGSGSSSGSGYGNNRHLPEKFPYARPGNATKRSKKDSH